MKLQKAAKLFGKRVQSLRKQKGLKQDQLAEKAGLSSWEQISKIERGVSSTNLTTVIAMAEALDVPLAELFDFSLEDIKDRKKSDALKELVAFLQMQDELFIRYTHEQARLTAEHSKKK